MFAKVNGTELFYAVHGEGRPMLVMHGGLGVDHTVFRPWLDLLGDRFQLIFYDHRGNGRSERPASLAGVDHGTWAADADALRDHLGHDRIFILGNSYGGVLGQEYALRFGDRLDGLVLVSSLPAWDWGDVVLANVRARNTGADRLRRQPGGRAGRRRRRAKEDISAAVPTLLQELRPQARGGDRREDQLQRRRVQPGLRRVPAPTRRAFPVARDRRSDPGDPRPARLDHTHRRERRPAARPHTQLGAGRVRAQWPFPVHRGAGAVPVGRREVGRRGGLRAFRPPSALSHRAAPSAPPLVDKEEIHLREHPQTPGRGTSPLCTPPSWWSRAGGGGTRDRTGACRS